MKLSFHQHIALFWMIGAPGVFAPVIENAKRPDAGLEVAKQLGRKGGRKPKMTDSKIESAKKLLASGVPPKDVAKNLGVSIPTL
jgi:hypothetical protein